MRDLIALFLAESRFIPFASIGNKAMTGLEIAIGIVSGDMIPIRWAEAREISNVLLVILSRERGHQCQICLSATRGY